MVYMCIYTNPPILVYFRRPLNGSFLISFMTIWNTLQLFALFLFMVYVFGGHLLYFVPFGTQYQKISSNKCFKLLRYLNVKLLCAIFRRDSPFYAHSPRQSADF
jgi:hypothetical protein